LVRVARRFWNAFWFLILPFVLSIVIEILLGRLGVVEEFEIWHILLGFAVLAAAMYHLRERLPYWRDPESDGEGRVADAARDLREQIRECRHLLRRARRRISAPDREQIDATILRAEEVLTNPSLARLEKASDQLEEIVVRALGFARKSALREYIESLLLAILVALGLRAFVVEPFKIPSESMLSTLMIGDHIFVNKFRYGPIIPWTHRRFFNFLSPERGEVIVFAFPGYRNGAPPWAEPLDNEDFIKRIVGLPGDRISLQADQVVINGAPVPRCYVGIYKSLYWDNVSKSFTERNPELWLERLGGHIHLVLEEPGRPVDFGPVVVPKGEFFVMGDNRDNSNDSRSWGTVPQGNIKGRAMFIWWSNRPPNGFRWDRLGEGINAIPHLEGELGSGLERCRRELGGPSSAR